MPRRFWIVSEQYYPQETATGYLLTELAEGLAQHLNVNVLCGMPGQPEGRVRVPRREQRNGVSILRCAATTLNKDVFWQRLINLVTLSGSLFFQSIQRIGRQDDVLVVTNPPSLPFLAAAACWLRRARCVLLIHDVYPQVMVATGVIRQGALLTRCLDWLNQWLYRSVGGIVVLGRDMARLAAAKLEQGDDRVVVIPNWADLDQVVPGDRRRNTLLQGLGLVDKFIVQYAGNMGRPNDLESLIESAQQLANVPDIHFLFIGSGAKRRWLEQAISNSRLTNVTVLPNRPRSDQHNFLNACDIAVISLVRGMTGLAVPSRMYNILAAGKPIIAVVEDDSEVALVVREEQAGWVVPPDQPAKIVEAILQARSHPQRIAEMGRRARQAAESKYSLAQVIESYLTLIQGLDTGMCFGTSQQQEG